MGKKIKLSQDILTHKKMNDLQQTISKNSMNKMAVTLLAACSFVFVLNKMLLRLLCKEQQ